MAFFDWWLGVPRWVRLLIALAALAYPVYLFWTGIIWPWGLTGGACLLALAFPRPLGPPPARHRPWRNGDE